jgi:hypothetical protein
MYRQGLYEIFIFIFFRLPPLFKSGNTGNSGNNTHASAQQAWIFPTTQLSLAISPCSPCPTYGQICPAPRIFFASIRSFELFVLILPHVPLGLQAHLRQPDVDGWYANIIARTLLGTRTPRRHDEILDIILANLS